MPHGLKDELWSMFEDVIDALQGAGKLGVVLFQFPHWFMPRKDSFRHFESGFEGSSLFPVAP